MTIYVDKLRRYRNRPRRQGPSENWSCRMFTDPTEDLETLKQFAASIGVPETAFHNAVVPHFDIEFPKRCDAIARSAVELTDSRVKDIEAAWRRFWHENGS